MCINGNTQKDGKHISWTHLNALYDKSRFTSGLSLIPKLKKEHLHLNSYILKNASNLAAQVRNLHGNYMIDFVLIISIQVLSTSVANGFDFYGLEETKETEKFVHIMVDKFFDCLDVRCTSAGVHHRKPDLSPYRNPDDPRLKVSIYHLMYNNSEINTVHLQRLKDDFLGYLDQWNDSVK